jgi:hypothetical protein
VKKIVLILNLFVLNFYGQEELSKLNSIATKIFDCELNSFLPSDNEFNRKSIVIVTNMNCLDCVKYFKKSNRINFLFVLNYESLSEINQILETYELNRKHCYFVPKQNLLEYKDEILNNPSPVLLRKNKTVFNFFNYTQLDSLSRGFNDGSYNFLNK